jgi:transcriptional regulator of acetoin/glycerol metabolism
MAGSPRDAVVLTEEVAAESAVESPAPPAELTTAVVRECVEREKGNLERAARQLGLKNRFALYRLMKKLDIKAGPAGSVDPK